MEVGVVFWRVRLAPGWQVPTEECTECLKLLCCVLGTKVGPGGHLGRDDSESF